MSIESHSRAPRRTLRPTRKMVHSFVDIKSRIMPKMKPYRKTGNKEVTTGYLTKNNNNMVSVLFETTMVSGTGQKTSTIITRQ